MKGKSSKEMLEKFIEFKTAVEKETGKAIKILRTDGGGEYQKAVSVYLMGLLNNGESSITTNLVSSIKAKKARIRKIIIKQSHPSNPNSNEHQSVTPWVMHHQLSNHNHLE